MNFFGGDRRCAHAQYEIVRIIKANGAVELKANCADCPARGFGIKHSAVKNIDDLRLASDERLSVPPCVRCGARGTELHHWAPRALFDDCEVWPTAWLCVQCHVRWHQVMGPK